MLISLPVVLLALTLVMAPGPPLHPLTARIQPIIKANVAPGGNPKCWYNGPFKWETCCTGEQPYGVAQGCWAWPYTPGFCCVPPIQPRPPLTAGGLRSWPPPPRSQTVSQSLPNISSDAAATTGSKTDLSVPIMETQFSRTARCPEDLIEGKPATEYLACTMSLDELGVLFEMAEIGSGDKASGWHDYLGQYERHLLHLPLSANLLELGVRSGVSLAMWSEYFPFGTIVGVDKEISTFQSIGRPFLERHGAFRLGNVRTVEGNATDVSILPMLAEAGVSDNFVHIVIDDANHWFADQIARFELYFPTVLRPGGTYIIEDVHIQIPFEHDGKTVRQYFFELSKYAYVDESEVLVGAHTIEAVRRMKKSDWRRQVDSVTFLRDVVIITKAFEAR